MHPVKLQGQQVILREFDHGDLADSLRIVGDDEVTNWLSFDSRSEDEVRTMLNGIVARAREQPRAEYYLAVARPADRAVIGFARLGLAGVRAAKLGFAIRRGDWGRGYATDAARILITFGFGELGLHRISAAAGPDNAASLAVIKRLGMTYEGRIRDHVFTNGAWRDSLLYSLLADEWVPGQPVAVSSARSRAAARRPLFRRPPTRPPESQVPSPASRAASGQPGLYLLTARA